MFEPKMYLNLCLFIFLWVFIQTSHALDKENITIYHLVSDYDAYVEKFKALAGEKNTIQMTHLGTGKEICKNNLVCRFFVYLYEPEDKSKIKYTILFNSGMHGNELIGPTSLLYAYPLLKPANTRIIYFPVSNPSGYTLKQRLTYPEKLDLNRDFPIDNNIECYRGTSTYILDHLFRQYKIDLTLNLHNGADQIGWNWGTNYHYKFSHTEDYAIYKQIGEMLKFYGGYNQRLKIQEFKIGTMNEVVYPAQGTFDDWAYAASWAQSVSHKCQNYIYKPYPIQMHKCLVFLFELGRHSAPEGTLGTSEGLDEPSNSKNINNGYVTRALRMFRQLIKVIDPVFTAQMNQQGNNNIIAKIQGCGKIINVTVQLNNPQNTQILASIKQQIPQFIHVGNSFSYLFTIYPHNNIIINKFKSLTLFYRFKCDAGWIGKGRSVFAKPRQFEGSYIIHNHNYVPNDHTQILKVNGQIAGKSSNTLYYALIALGILMLILILYRIVCYKRSKKVQFQEQTQELPRISNQNKTQAINYQVIENTNQSLQQQQPK